MRFYNKCIYAGDSPDYNILLTTWYVDASSPNRQVLDTVTLKNGNEAEITGDFDISWKNDKGYIHDLSVIFHPGVTGYDFTINDLIDVANSVE